MIDAAAQQARQVTVVVLASNMETIAPALRLEWLRSVHENPAIVCVAVNDPVLRQNAESPLAAREALVRSGLALAESERRERGQVPLAVDVLWGLDQHGESLADRLAVAYCCPDPGRVLYPLSGAQVRREPARYWSDLATPVQQWLQQRVVVIGAEASGTSTLARELAAHYRKRGGAWSITACVAESSREYVAVKQAAARGQTRFFHQPPPTVLSWHSDEFLQLAQRQTAWENRAAASSGPLMICDTDALACAVAHEQYCGTRRPELESAVARLPPRLLYLVTDIEGLPADGEDRGGQQLRYWAQQRYIDRLHSSKQRWRLLSGSPRERLERAVSHIDKALALCWCFAAPPESW